MGEIEDDDGTRPERDPADVGRSAPAPAGGTRIEIADEPGQRRAGGDLNWWIPMVVVPLGIGIVIVLVVGLFSGIAGEQRSIAENLHTVVHGGTNRREQALFSLTLQALDNHEDTVAGRAPRWPMEDGFAQQLQAALAEVDEDDHRVRLVLAVFLESLEPGAGVPILLDLLEVGPDQDESGLVRGNAMMTLGNIGDPRAAGPILAFLGDEDDGLRTMAAAALQKLGDDPAVRAGLLAALSDRVFEVRANAALSLSYFEPTEPEELAVLREMLDRSVYAADPAKYPGQQFVSQIRVKAVHALGRAGGDEVRPLLEALRSEPDLRVREAALKVLQQEDFR